MDWRHSHHLIEIRYQQWFTQPDRYIFKWGKKNTNSLRDIAFPPLSPLTIHLLPSFPGPAPSWTLLLHRGPSSRAWTGVSPSHLHLSHTSHHTDLPVLYSKTLAYLSGLQDLLILVEIFTVFPTPCGVLPLPLVGALKDQRGFVLRNLKEGKIISFPYFWSVYQVHL